MYVVNLFCLYFPFNFVVLLDREQSTMGRDSAVSIVTAYGLDGPGIESRWGARFSAPVQTGPEAHA